MKKLLMVSVIATFLVSTAAYAEQSYTQIRDGQARTVTGTSAEYDYEALTARAQEQQQRMDQAVRSYQMNYNDSYTRFWDRYTDAYQRSKKISN